MRRGFVVVVIAFLCLSVAAMAANKQMSDQAMASVTAGSNFNASGAVAAGGSTVNVYDNASAALSNSALQNASALSIVNATGGKVGIGVNVWDGSLAAATSGDPRSKGDDHSGSSDPLKMKQLNVISNSAPLTKDAELKDYQSSGSLSIVNPSLAITNTSSSSKSGSVSDTKNLQINQAEATTFASTFNHTYANHEDTTVRSRTAAAGFVAAGVDLSRHDVEGGLVGAFAARKSFNLSESDTTQAATAATKNFAHSETFALTKTDAFAKNWNDTQSDQFGLNFSADSIAFRGPIEIDKAEAQYIAVDDSTVNASSYSTLALGANAEFGASAVSIVNAVNSLVGVGVNVGRTPSSGLSDFKQVNIIKQR